MKTVAVHNLNHPNFSPLSAIYCETFLCRLRGLTFRRNLPRDKGLLLVQARDNRVDSAIHMLAVFTDLAAVWINQTSEVVDVRLAKSWRPGYVPRRPARYVLEIHPDRLSDFKVGDRIHFE